MQPLGKKVILNEFSVVDNTKSFLFRAKVECFSQQSFFQGMEFAQWHQSANFLVQGRVFETTDSVVLMGDNNVDIKMHKGL